MDYKTSTKIKSSKNQGTAEKLASRNSLWPIIFILLAFAILPYGSFFFSDQMLFGSDTMGGLDARTLYANEIKNGNFPLWFPTRLSGMPTIDALFGDAFYPANVLTLIFPIYRALGYKIVLHVFLAGLFFFFLLYKGYSLDRWVSLLGAILYMLNTEFISHTYPGHDGKMYVISLLPLAVWMLERLLQKATIRRSCLLGISVGLCLLTSHIQMTYFVLWGLFAYAMFRIFLVIHDEKNWKKAGKIFSCFWIGIFLGLGIGMIELLPPFMYVREGMSVRGPEKGFEYAASWSLHPEETASLVVPEFGNTLENYWGHNYFKLNSEYIGLLANLLFVFSLILFFERTNIFWLCVSAFSLFYSLGSHTPIFKLAYYLIPGVKSFRGPGMLMLWFSFAFIFTGAKGLQKYLNEAQNYSEDKKQKTWKRILISSGIILGLCLILSAAKDSVLSIWQSLFYSNMPMDKAKIMTENYPNFVKGLWIFGILTSISLLSLGAYGKKMLGRTTLIAILFAVGIADLWRADARFIQTANPSQYAYSDYTIKQILADPETKRVFDLPGAYNNNYVGIFGLESVVGFHDNELKWYRTFRGENSSNLIYNLANGNIDKNPFLNLLNAKYFLYRQEKNNPVQIIPNSGYLPRAFLVDSYEVLPDSLAIERLKDPSFDYRRKVILETQPQDFAAQIDTSTAGTALYKRISADKFRIQVNSTRNSLMLVSEVYFPGWTAKLDGRATRIIRTDVALMSVFVPAGQHVLEFSMHSKYLNLGASITLLSIIVILGIISFTGFFSRKKEIP